MRSFPAYSITKEPQHGIIISSAEKYFTTAVAPTRTPNHKPLHLPEIQRRAVGNSPETRCRCSTAVPDRMSSNLEQVGRNQLSTRGGVPSTSPGTSTDGSPNGYSPSVTIRSPERTVAGSGPGSLKGAESPKIGAGIWNDVRSRIPYYASDWTDAWNYRVVPATTLIFFAKYGGLSTERPGLRDLLF